MHIPDRGTVAQRQQYILRVCAECSRPVTDDSFFPETGYREISAGERVSVLDWKQWTEGDGIQWIGWGRRQTMDWVIGIVSVAIVCGVVGLVLFVLMRLMVASRQALSRDEVVAEGEPAEQPDRSR